MPAQPAETVIARRHRANRSPPPNRRPVWKKSLFRSFETFFSRPLMSCSNGCGATSIFDSTESGAAGKPECRSASVSRTGVCGRRCSHSRSGTIGLSDVRWTRKCSMLPMFALRRAWSGDGRISGYGGLSGRIATGLLGAVVLLIGSGFRIFISPFGSVRRKRFGRSAVRGRRKRKLQLLPLRHERRQTLELSLTGLRILRFLTP